MSNFFGKFKKNEPPVVEEEPPAWEDRIFWIDTLQKIAFPILNNLKKDSLRKNMEIESSSKEGEKFTCLEAFARVFNGIAPWLELGAFESDEGKLREKYIKLTIQAISNAANPKKNDYMLYADPKKSLVDMALFTQGLLRSKTQIWQNLPMDVQAKIIKELKNSRIIAPYDNHWLLFTSMIEAALLEFTGECDKERLVYSVHKFRDEWYIGDGIYGDGDEFRSGFYNSIFIHPLLNDILIVMRKYGLPEGEFLDIQLMRSSRLSSQLERCISPEGTFPLIGESISYRCGVFHTLSQVALLKILPKNIEASQIRAALTKVLRRLFEGSQNFTEDNFLVVGLNASQKGMAENTITTGSLYMCCCVFLPLGLDSNNPFWSDRSIEWTSLKAWNGHSCEADKSIDF